MSSEEDEDTALVDSDAVEVEAAPARDEPAEIRSMEARRKLREQMQADIDAFLRSGGHIEQVATNVSALDLQALGPESG